MGFWLLKAEPDSRVVNGVDVKYSIDDLERDHTSTWEGVRNYEARNSMLKMKLGDKALFYRSNCKSPAVVGTMTVCKEAYPDSAAADPDHPYYEKNDKKRAKWVMVDVEYESHLTPVTLKTIKDTPDLSNMALLKRSRLSISPVTEREYNIIVEMGK